jgi:hypothetical protein
VNSTLDRAQMSFKSALYKAFRIKILTSTAEPRLGNRYTVLVFSRKAKWFLFPIACSLCLALSGCIGDVVSRSATLSLVASSKSISLGRVPVGKSATATLSLVNKNPVAVTITQLSMTGQSFSVGNQRNLPVSIAANSAYIVDIEFDPLVPGPTAGQLTIVTDASAHGTMLIGVSGVGAAVQPASKLNAISCAAASITGAGLDTCTVTISGAAPGGGFTVNLSSDNAAVNVPTTLVIPENATSIQFTANVSAVSNSQIVTLSATANGESENFALQLSASVPALNISAKSIAFGEVLLNTSATQSLTLTSAGTAPVTISAATITGTAFSVSGASFPLTLSAGQSATLSVQFDPIAAAAANGQLTITSNASPSSTKTVSLAGIGEAPALSSFSCNSGQITGSGTDLCTVKLSASTGSGAEIVSLSSSNAAVSVPATVTVPAKAISAQFTASVTSVESAQPAILTASAGGASINFAIQLNAYVPSLKIGATSLAFGNVPLNTSAIQSVTLTSTGTAPVTIGAATITGTAFSVSGATLPLTVNPGQSATLSVQFDPAAAGSASGQLTITSNDKSGSTVIISLAGTGEAPAVSVFSCATNAITGAATELCTVKLSASTGSSAEIVSLSSSDAAVSVPATVTVPAKAISVQFAASVTSVETAQQVTLTASAGGASINFALQLNAYVPTLKIGVTSLSFGNVPLNTSATQSLTLTSTGTAPVTISAATPTGTGFSLQGATFPLTVNPGKSGTLSVQFNPTATGSASGQLTITSNDKSGSTAIVSLAGTGTSDPSIKIVIAPSNVSAAVGETQQFSVSVTGTPKIDVTWKISGTGCAGTACGTISSAGLFTAPEAVPSPATITVTATSQADPSQSATADVTITSYLATATVSESPGISIPSDFLGLSHEWGMAEFFAGTKANGKNLQYRQLLQNLLQYSTEPMIIRIGGNSTDLTTSLRAVDLESINDLNADLENKLKFSLGINMASDDPAIATAETKAISAAIPAASLVGLELGNEPDCWAADGLRPADYSFAEYAAQLNTWIKLVADASNSQLSPISPAFCLSNWISGYEELLPSSDLAPELITQHYYAGEYLVAQPKPLNFLLADVRATSGPTKLASYISVVHEAGKKIRIGEMNSMSNGGQPGVSDAFGSALWGVDIMFEFAKAGADGVNWHTGNGGAYDLFQFHTKTDPSSGLSDYSLSSVRPLFYGLQFFAEATTSNGALLPVTMDTKANVKVWALIGDDGLLRVVILNKDERQTGTVKLVIPGYTLGTVSRLLAPSLSAQTQVTLGNQTYDGSVDGKMIGELETEQIEDADGSFTLTMSKVSAALITFSK